MTAAVLPVHGRWTWDARGEGRAVRVSTHVEQGLVNLSLWRGETCVGTARLAPDDVAGLVTGLTEGLATLAARPRVVGPDATRVADLEARLAVLERRRQPVWRRAADAVTGWGIRAAVRSKG
ncbi:hypothetical protein [Blastococcus saxobsidens]|uniref:Uncharacterized protein n=1 Tax=Blastococcus saxobsidens (strain DD2) TaxID=1146883 RepID=H6RJH6_BLASD|nr:hypothetical protein [Blastococcus saxobsidens]CCG02281.1 protein of unknown function [Blastococcus saxobsidens DD2]